VGCLSCKVKQMLPALVELSRSLRSLSLPCRRFSLTEPRGLMFSGWPRRYRVSEARDKAPSELVRGRAGSDSALGFRRRTESTTLLWRRSREHETHDAPMSEKRRMATKRSGASESSTRSG